MMAKTPIVSFLFSVALFTAAHAENKATVPQVPEALSSTKASIAEKKPDGLTLTVESTTPLTTAQWQAIASLHLHSFVLVGQALDDQGVMRLGAMNPVMITVNGSTVTGKGAAMFGLMKSLKTLHTLHITKPTPEAKATLSVHPTLETFSTDGAFCIEAITAPHLKSVDLKHGAADDRYVAMLKDHPSLESVRLWNRNYATLTDACIASLVTIPKLNKLSLEFAVFTYAGGLNRLKEAHSLATLDLKDDAISDEDLAKLKADLPKVKITFTPMTAEYRAERDAKAAKKK